jgi:hypothetical protein
MTMRICIFGNSHVGALKQGADGLCLPSDIEVDFYGLPGEHFNTVRFCPDNYTISSSNPASQDWMAKTGGRREFRVDHYTHLVYAAGSNFLDYARFSSQYPVPVSRSLCRCLMSQAVHNPAMQMVTQLSSIPSLSVYYLGSPLKSEADPAYVEFRSKASSSSRSWSFLYRLMIDELDSLLPSSGLSFRFIPPHNDLLDALSLATLSEYSIGAKCVLGKWDYPEKEWGHMNPAYGAKMMRHILSCIGSWGCETNPILSGSPDPRAY